MGKRKTMADKSKNKTWIAIIALGILISVFLGHRYVVYLFELPACSSSIRESTTQPVPFDAEPAVHYVAVADRSGTDLTEGLFILLVGILVGGLIKVLVDCVLLRFRRRAVTKALLVEIRACRSTAKSLGHWLDEHVLKNWKESVFRKQYLHTIDKPLWDAALKDLRQLPPHYLAGLVSFYSFTDSINRKVFAFNQEQERLESFRKEEKPDMEMGTDITEALVQMAYTTARMCDELAKCESVKHLRDLPTSYKSEYPRFKIS